MTTGLGGVLIDSGEVGLFEIGVFVENFLLGHASPKPAEDIPDGDAQAADAGFAPRLPGSTVILAMTTVGMAACSLVCHFAAIRCQSLRWRRRRFRSKE